MKPVAWGQLTSVKLHKSCVLLLTRKELERGLIRGRDITGVPAQCIEVPFERRLILSHIEYLSGLTRGKRYRRAVQVDTRKRYTRPVENFPD